MHRDFPNVRFSLGSIHLSRERKWVRGKSYQFWFLCDLFMWCKMIISTISEILEKPFKNFTKEEQYEIIKQGRFTDLTKLCQNDKGKYRTFSTSWYKRVNWLTGNTVNKRLYCWHCVLFPAGPVRIWNYHGFDDLKNMSQSIKKHEESKEHIYSSIKLKLMMNTKRIGNHQHQIQTIDNIRVKRNRKYLERLIDIASALLHFEIPFRPIHEESFYQCKY